MHHFEVGKFRIKKLQVTQLGLLHLFGLVLRTRCRGKRSKTGPLAGGKREKKNKGPEKKGQKKHRESFPFLLPSKTPPTPGRIYVFLLSWPLSSLGVSFCLFLFGCWGKKTRKKNYVQYFSSMRHAYHAGEGIIHDHIVPLHVKIKVTVQLVNVFPVTLPSVLMGQFPLKTDIECNPIRKMVPRDVFLQLRESL